MPRQPRLRKKTVNNSVYWFTKAGDFRHLWISEALMCGNDIATVAQMAGTSIAMIENVYGHFRTDHLQQAQDKLDRVRRERRG